MVAGMRTAGAIGLAALAILAAGYVLGWMDYKRGEDQTEESYYDV